MGAVFLSPPALPLKSRAIAWLAQREHSRTELRRKLLDLVARQRRQAGDQDGASECDDLVATDPTSDRDGAQAPGRHAARIDPQDTERAIEALLDNLAAKGLLSDERFVESRIHVRAPRYGNLRIRQELSRHGVTLDADTAEVLQATELERARAVWAKRYGHPAPDAAGRARQARFLTARGFSSDVVRHVVRHAVAGDAGDSEGDPAGDTVARLVRKRGAG